MTQTTQLGDCTSTLVDQKILTQQEGAVWEGLADCYDAGLAQSVGVSNYGPQQLRKVDK